MGMPKRQIKDQLLQVYIKIGGLKNQMTGQSTQQAVMRIMGMFFQLQILAFHRHGTTSQIQT